MIVFASAIGFLVGIRLGLALFVENSISLSIIVPRQLE